MFALVPYGGCIIVNDFDHRLVCRQKQKKGDGMNKAYSEDAMMIARNILSGNNSCELLQKAVAVADVNYFAAAAEPVLKVKREEIAHVRGQRDKASSEAESLRFALEVLVQNLVPVISPHPGGMLLPHNSEIRLMLENALGRPLTWESG